MTPQVQTVKVDLPLPNTCNATTMTCTLPVTTGACS